MSKAAPSDYAEVESFLDALQKRLSVINEHPEELDKTPYPFKGPEKIAKTVGLKAAPTASADPRAAHRSTSYCGDFPLPSSAR